MHLRKVSYLNKVLKDEGFSIQLKRRPPQDNQLGVVSILDVMVKWLHEGNKTVLEAADENRYPAVAMSKGFDLYHTSVHNHPVIAIPTKNGDNVFITVADKQYESFELLSRIKEIRKASIKKDHVGICYNEIVFPMVDYDKELSLDWLVGLRSRSGFIAQALQQVKFKMNEEGAHVKSAVALSVERACIQLDKSTYTVDKPFLIWIERPEAEAPILADYIDYSSWKDPGTLDSK